MIPSKIKPAVFQTLPNRLLSSIAILLFTALISVSGYLLILQQKQFLLREKQEEIKTIADLKVSQLVQWRAERFIDGAYIQSNPMVVHRLNDYLSGKDQASVRREFRLWMSTLINVGGYHRGMLCAPDGSLIASDSDLTPPLTVHYLNLVAEAAKGHELLLTDFHVDAGGIPIDLDLVIPIMDISSSPHRCIAVLILDIDPAKRLYPLIQSWPKPGSSAETLLVKKEGNYVHFLNELRHREKSSAPFYLPLTDKNLPAVRALSGGEGSFEGVDYRNVAVICVTRRVPGTQWGLVAKIDAGEVYTPLKSFISYVILFGVITISAVIIGVFWWSVRKKAELLLNQVELQKKNELELQDVKIGLEQQVQERISDLIEINTLLRQEMDNRERLELKLLSAKRYEAIGQIAGGVAHEVRNPLNAILTITEALFREQEIENNPSFVPYIQHIRTQVNRLVILMNDLLDLGREIPAINIHPLSLDSICRNALALWNSTGMSSHRAGTFTSGSNGFSETVLADGQKLQQVFFNLLENAGNHCQDGCSIVMKTLPRDDRHPDGMAIVQIVDQGTGIPEDKLPYVFDPFYTGRKGGTGLGLALVKHFIESMGGNVKIWNNDPPPGCTVEVNIPLHRKESQ
ncbi:MAG: sensor histidine kinase [Desulfuromonadaceae bacterium]|nr:sensor histidine kinase [Desulfuromonadaceae bacterium]